MSNRKIVLHETTEVPVDVENSEPPVVISTSGRRIINTMFYVVFSVALGFGASVAWMVLSGGGVVACGRFHPQRAVEAVDLATGADRALTYEVSYCRYHSSLWHPFSKCWKMTVFWWPSFDDVQSDGLEQREADQPIVCAAAFDTMILPRFGPDVATEPHRKMLIERGGLVIFEAKEGAAVGQVVVFLTVAVWTVGLFRVVRGKPAARVVVSSA